MTDQPLALTVEQGLHTEQELLAAVCRGERENGVLFWRPTDHALVMPRRIARWPMPGGGRLAAGSRALRTGPPSPGCGGGWDA